MATSPIILVIEDDPSILDLMTYVLAEEGYFVVSVLWPQQGLQNVLVMQPQLVICDLMLGGMLTGPLIVLTIRATPGLETVPILICSALRSREVKALMPRDIGWLVKPFMMDELVTRVQQMLQL